MTLISLKVLPPSPKREVKHDPLPIRSPNHHGTDRRFYRAVPEQEDEAVKDLIEDALSFIAVSTFIATFAVWAAYLAEKV